MRHEFVEYIPEKLSEGVVYVCLGFDTIVHSCACGCGNEVVTPLSPTDWKITYNGESVSLSPSIGNWGFECRSHYWITNGHVRWSGDWTDKEVSAGRRQDRNRKKRYYSGNIEEAEARISEVSTTPHQSSEPKKRGFWAKVWERIF